MDTRFSAGTAVFVTLVSGLIQPLTIQAEEVDFSCMHKRVLNKTMVTERYKEFDVILENECPGAVYWTMCIEKTDAFTHRVTETLTPSGQLEKDKKFRINLQMFRQEDESMKLSGYEEFYTNVVYDIHSVSKPECIALRCENEKKPVRDQLRSNQRAIQKAQADADRKMKSDCPQDGWSNAQQEKCMAEIDKASKAVIEPLMDKDKELQKELASINPELCELN